MNQYEHKRIIILVKTYPHPSNKSIETVCTAGLTEDGKWIRIYPIPFRYLAGDKQFKTFQWIEADVVKRPKNKDYRKESYSVDTDSIVLLDHLDSEDDAAKRFRLVSDAATESFEALINAHQTQDDKPTLAAVKPYKMYDLKFEKVDPDWTPTQKAMLNQFSIFDQDLERKPLQKVPYKIKCCFDDSNKDHTHHELSLTDWQYNFTLLKLLSETDGDDQKAKDELNKRWLTNFKEDRESYLFFGTALAEERFHTFITIGYCSISKEYIKRGEQLSLFDQTERSSFFLDA